MPRVASVLCQWWWTISFSAVYGDMRIQNCSNFSLVSSDHMNRLLARLISVRIIYRDVLYRAILVYWFAHFLYMLNYVRPVLNIQLCDLLTLLIPDITRIEKVQRHFTKTGFLASKIYVIRIVLLNVIYQVLNYVVYYSLPDLQW